MVTRSKTLCDRLYSLSVEARGQGTYASMMALTTAGDLSDGMLKGDEGPAAVDHLLLSYARNFGHADGPEDQAAWGDALAQAREVFELPVGYLPAETE